MAQRGEGREDFRAEAAEIAALNRARQEMAAKEALFQAELAATEGAVTSTQQAEARRVGVKREQVEVSERAVRVEGSTARTTKLSTEAIEANTRARERNHRAMRQQAEQAGVVNGFSRQALRGARDPLFEQTRIRGLESQYAMRRELGIGQSRAAALQAAGREGLVPSTKGADRPLTRRRAAELELERAEAELAQATKDRTRARRRKDATDSDRLVASDAVASARSRRAAATIELESAHTYERELREAGRQRQEAVRREVEQARRAAPVGGALVPRTPANAGLRSAQELQRATVAAYGQPGPQYGAYPYAPATRSAGKPGFDDGTPTEVANRRLAERSMNASHAAAAQRDMAKASSTLTEEEQRLARALTDEQRVRADQNYSRAEHAINSMATAQGRSRDATRFMAVEFGTASQAMRRHGALTSEFIAAAARGETTLRELGFQATATIGKFAGWTAAGAALYTALGAVQRLGTGAIQASSGVDQLDRVINNVNPETATAAFRGLANDYNVPIETVADAVYRMGQRFHALPDAVEASRAALLSLKTGEVDVATSTENLIAITNGFGLQAGQLTSVYDQINQAQNTFGIRIGDTEAGLAKAAGTYRNAGGDLNFLLGLFVAISRATNRPGTEIGTGISRAAVRIREDQSKRLLRSQGIDPTPDDLQQTIKNALAAARRGGDVQALSQAVFGNQYARLFTAVLRDQTTLNEALKDTSPEAAKGSANKELAKVLSQVDEQITQVGISLERLGSALADAHVFDGLGGLLQLLNSSLDIAVQLVDVFNLIPDPIRQAVIYLGQAGLLLGAMRKFGPESLGKRFPSLSPLIADPDERAKTLATRGARDQLQEVQNTRERLVRRRVSDAVELEARRTALAEFDKTRYSPGLAKEPRYSGKSLALAAERADLEDQVRQAERRSASTIQETLALKKVQLTAEQELAHIRSLEGSAVRAYLIDNRIPLPESLDTPNAGGAGYLKGPPAPSGRPRDVLRYMDEMERALDPIQQMGPKSQRALRAMEDGLQKTTKRLASTGSLVGRGLDALAVRGVNVSTRAISAGERAATRLREVPGRVKEGLSSLASSIGFLDRALIAFIGAEFIADAARKNRDEITERGRKIQRNPINRSQYDSRLRALREQAEEPYKFVNDLTSEAKDIVATPLRQGWFVGGLLDKEDSPYQEARRRRRQDAEGEIERLRRDRQRQESERSKGRPVSNRFAPEIVRDAQRLGRQASEGMVSLRELNEGIDRAAQEASNSRYIGPGRQTRVKARLDRIRRLAVAALDPSNFAARFDQAGPSELREQLALGAQRIETPGLRGDKFGVREIRAIYRRLVRSTADARTPEEIQAVYKDREDYYKALRAAADQELAIGLSSADNEGERQGAYRARVRAENQPVQDARRRAARTRRDVQQARTAQQAATRALQGAEANAAALPGTSDVFRGGGFASIASARAAYDAATEKVREVIGRRARDTKAVQEALDRRQAALLELRESRYEDRAEGRGIQRDLALSRLDPDDQAGRQAIDERFARAQLRAARRYQGPGRARKIAQAMTELNNIVNQSVESVTQDAISQIEALGAIREARAGSDPIARARAALTTAQQVRGYYRSHGGSLTERRQALAALINAQNTLDDSIRENAAAIAGLSFDIASARAEGDPVRQARIAQQKAADARRRASNQQERLQAVLDQISANNQLEDALSDREQARFEFLSSRTADPVRQARIERRAARRAVRRETPGTADYYRARARENEANRNLIEQRVTDRRDDIEFALDFDRIGTDVAIRQYRSLLKIHGLTKQVRRDILRRIRELQEGDGSELDVNVGDIKLPTLYDVRRLALAGVNGGSTRPASAPLQQTNAYTFHVRNQADADAIGGTLHDIHRTNRAALRNAQLTA